MLRMSSTKWPRIIVLGNLKGGSGKSTLSMHVAIALMKAGRRVATLDLDFHQRTLTRYLENRRNWASKRNLTLDVPTHFCLDQGFAETPLKSEDEQIKFVVGAVDAAQAFYDIIVIDTPSGANRVNLFAHGLADTVLTPINDSFLDLDVIATLKDSADQLVPSPYAEIIHRAIDARRSVTNRNTDWVVLRNRLSSLESRNERAVRNAVEAAASAAGFRTATGLTERLIYREFFPMGLTAFDSMETSLLGVKPSLSHVMARQEVRQLLTIVNPTASERRDPWGSVPGAQERRAVKRAV